MIRKIIFAWIFIRICFGLFGGQKVFAQSYFERSGFSADYFRTIKSTLFKFSTDTTAPAAGYFKIVAKDSTLLYLITSSGNKLNLKTAATGGDITSVVAGFGLTGGATDGAATLVVDSTVMATLYDLTLKANLASPTFTGTVTVPLGAGTVRSSSGGVLSVSAADTVGLGTALALLAPKASPTFTGTITTPLGAGTVRSSAGGVLSSTAADTVGLAAALAAKAPLASPTFTGTVTTPLGAGRVRSSAGGVLSVVTQAQDTAGYVLNIPATDSSRIAGTVPDGAITNGKLGTDAVTTGKILDGTILAGDLNADAVTTVKIQDLAVTSGKLASDAVTSAKILDATIAAGDIGTDAVTSAKILDATIAAGDLGTDAVINEKIQDGAVTTAKIANGTLLTADQNSTFKAYDSDSTDYARQMAKNYTVYLRGDTARVTDAAVTSSWKFTASWDGSRIGNGSIYVDSVWSGGFRVVSNYVGEPDSSKGIVAGVKR